jgi:hypothetical protein
MLTIHGLRDQIHEPARRVALTLSIVGALVLTACGGSATSSSSSGGAASTPTPTPEATATPGPSSVQATLSGDPGIGGALVTGSVHFVTCDEPSLSGPDIVAFRSATNPAIGVLLTIRQGAIAVRLASGAASTYTERLFDGTGVTSFDASSGATFSSSLTESTPAGTQTGTLGMVTSISGSVSCGTFKKGSASVTVAGGTAGGDISGVLTMVRVLCGTSGPGQQYATVTGLGKVGSTPAVITVGGGQGTAPLFVAVQTSSTTYQYSTSAAGSATVTTSGATYNATATETAPTAGAHSLMVSGSATCGTSS